MTGTTADDAVLEPRDELIDGRITDQALAEMRLDLGVEKPVTPTWYGRVTADAVWHFALGLGDDNPLWWPPVEAAQGRAERAFAPPAFLYALTHEVTAPGHAVQSGDAEWLPGVAGLWAGDRWVWHTRIWVGEAVAVTRCLEEVREREGGLGRSIVQTDAFKFFGEDERLIAELRRSVVRFERAAGRSSGKYLNLEPAHYDDSQRQAIIDQYAIEAAARRGPRPRYWEDVAVGEQLPPLVKGPLTLTGMIGWLIGSGASQTPTNRMLFGFFDKHPHARLFNPSTGVDDTLEGGHWEPHYSRAAGLPRGYDFGGQRIAFATHLATDWCGDDGDLIALDARLRAPNLIGDTTWFSGIVTETRPAQDGRGQVTCAISGTNQRGEETISAIATVELPLRG